MASRAEQNVSRALRAILADLPTGADVLDSEQFRYVQSGLESFVPEVLREIHAEWHNESLDGFYPVVARKTETAEIEMVGLCILISDQTLTPIYLRFQIAPSADEVSWFECHLGERGKNGIVRMPYGSLDKALHREYERLYLLDGQDDTIDWVYKVTFGIHRT